MTDSATSLPSEPGAVPGATAPGRLAGFAVLASPPFRRLWLNSFCFFLIQSTQRFAYVWLVLVLGGGPAAAGIVSFAVGIPVLLLGIPAGVLSDRADRRLLLIGSQAVALVVTLATAFGIWTDMITLGSTYVLAFLLGTTLAFGQPVRQAIVPSIVDRPRLMNAIALMTMGMNVSLIAGPALGGGVIALWGLAGAFAVQAGLYAIAMLPLVRLRLPATLAVRERHAWAEAREGIGFIVHHRGIRALVGLLAVSGFFMIGPFQALLPHIARVNLGRDAFEASLLFTAIGVGMFLTSLLLASWRHIPNKGGLFTANLVLGGLILAAVGLSTSYVLTVALMFVWGLGGGLFINLNQTLIQSHTPPELMGRVMSVHMLSFMGVGPIGSLVAGGAAGLMGAGTWILVSGLVVAVLALTAVFTTPTLRRMA